MTARLGIAAAVAAASVAVSTHSCAHDNPALQADQQSVFNAALRRDKADRRATRAAGRAFQPATAPPQPIRIKVFTKDLDDDSKFCLNGKNAAVGDFRGGQIECDTTGKNDLTAEKKSYLVNKLLPEAVSQLSALLSPVVRQDTLYVKSCSGMAVPSTHAPVSSGIADADFALYVGASPASSVAWSSVCGIHRATKQPYAGRAIFNPEHIDPTAPVASSAIATVHELIHLLGFSKMFFGNEDYHLIPLKNVTNRRGLDFVTVLAGPASIREARRFYDCDDLEGIELENEGGSGSHGSHMERRVAKDELMGPVGGPGISRMTLAVFEDLGFYSPNYDALETDPRFSGHQPQFGRGRGCGFVREKCNTVAGGKDREFCFQQKTDPTCAPNHMGMGTCNVKEFTKALPPAFQYFDDPKRGGGGYMDGCPVFNNWNDCSVNSNGFPGTISENSRCVLGVNYGSAGRFHRGTMPRCQRTKCVNGELHMVGNSGASVICVAVGDKVTPPGHMGQLICPDPAVICVPSSPKPTSPPPDLIHDDPTMPYATASGILAGESNTSGFDSERTENSADMAGATSMSRAELCFATVAKLVLVFALFLTAGGVK